MALHQMALTPCFVLFLECLRSKAKDCETSTFISFREKDTVLYSIGAFYASVTTFFYFFILFTCQMC